MCPVPDSWHWQLILSINLFIKEDTVILTPDKQIRLENKVWEDTINKAAT
jgi:hypothetical protein